MPEELLDWKPKEKEFHTHAPPSDLLRMIVAREWKLTPHEFELRNPNEQAKMIATHIATNYIETYNAEMAQIYAKQEARKNAPKKSGRNGKPRDMRLPIQARSRN